MLHTGFDPPASRWPRWRGWIGVAKTGIPGFGILAVPLMVLAVGDARHSAAWLLPLLCLADLFAIATYRRHAHARRLFGLLPWVLGGIALGALSSPRPSAPCACWSRRS